MFEIRRILLSQHGFILRTMIPRRKKVPCEVFSWHRGSSSRSLVPEVSTSGKTPLLLPTAVAFALIGSAMTWRWLRGELLNHETVVHRDGSKIAVISPAVQLSAVVDDDCSGASTTFQCDEVTLAKLRQALLTDVERIRLELVVETRALLTAELRQAFAPVHARVESFADWYFKYQTTYKLLLRAILAAGAHMKNLGSNEKLTDAITRDLEELICEKFLKIALRPESTDAACHLAFRASLDMSRTRFRKDMQSALRDRLSEFCSTADNIKMEASTAESFVQLDWRSQSFKAQSIAAAHEKSPELSLALVAAGAAAGKVAGGKVAAIAGGKALSVLSSKLSAPFAAKVITLLGPGAASVGAVVAGPIGALTGAAAGIATDMLLNAGSELLHRTSFEREAHDVISATQEEWDNALGTQLELAIAEWCNEVPEVTKNWLRANSS